MKLLEFFTQGWMPHQEKTLQRTCLFCVWDTEQMLRVTFEEWVWITPQGWRTHWICAHVSFCNNHKIKLNEDQLKHSVLNRATRINEEQKTYCRIAFQCVQCLRSYRCKTCTFLRHSRICLVDKGTWSIRPVVALNGKIEIYILWNRHFSHIWIKFAFDRVTRDFTYLRRTSVGNLAAYTLLQSTTSESVDGSRIQQCRCVVDCKPSSGDPWPEYCHLHQGENKVLYIYWKLREKGRSVMVCEHFRAMMGIFFVFVQQ